MIIKKGDHQIPSRATNSTFAISVASSVVYRASKAHAAIKNCWQHSNHFKGSKYPHIKCII